MDTTKSKFDALPVDARWYVDLFAGTPDFIGLAVAAHDQVCAEIGEPSAERVPYSGGTPDDAAAGMDDYIRAFVKTYCDLETLYFAETVTVN